MKHLTADQRYEIFALLEAKQTQTRIAEILNVNKSTICREIHRVCFNENIRYDPSEAQERAIRQGNYRKHLRKLNVKMRQLISIHIRMHQWSPEQIAGFCKKNSIQMVSTETIYQWVWKDKSYGGTLYKYLRHRGRRYRKRGNQYVSRSHNPDRRDISERPNEVEKRKRFGDFEIDTIVGATSKQHILTIVDRVAKLSLMYKMFRPTQEGTSQKIIELLEPFARQGLLHTITADNGFLFQKSKMVEDALQVKMYFARPYHSWERGTNENTNGLIRQYLPKGTDFTKVKDEVIHGIQEKLNNRPRKKLNYLTPNQYFKKLTD